MMRRFMVAIAATIGAALVAAGTPAGAQEPMQQVQTHQAGAGFYAPFIWNGNALDGKILDAQAEMVPLHRPIRQQLRHHHPS